MKKRKEQQAEPAWPQRWPKHLVVPPPDSDIWPPSCRGKRWKSVFAILFAGRCQLCAYACQPSEARRRLDKLAGLTSLLLCANHPDSPGLLREVLPIDTCRNFRPRRWQKKREMPSVRHDLAALDGDETIRHIPLSQNLFAIVDAADYEGLSKYKWAVTKRGKHVYASGTVNGKTVLMHRFIMRARRGYCVDHINGNGLNKLLKNGDIP